MTINIRFTNIFAALIERSADCHRKRLTKRSSAFRKEAAALSNVAEHRVFAARRVDDADIPEIGFWVGHGRRDGPLRDAAGGAGGRNQTRTKLALRRN
ncbi:MAG: hypothetical protein ABL908_19225, partial [Hyphomicrobium sp.]